MPGGRMHGAQPAVLQHIPDRDRLLLLLAGGARVVKAALPERPPVPWGWPQPGPWSLVAASGIALRS